MHRKERETAREAYDKTKAERALKARNAAALAHEREAKIRSVLVKRVDPLTPSVLADPVFRAVHRKIPQVLKDASFRFALTRLMGFVDGNKIPDWEPKGKSCKTVFRSICDQTVAKYPMPAFLWNTFLVPDQQPLIPLVGRVVKGESLFKLLQERGVPVTRQMCHEVMTTVGDTSLTGAIRRAQVKALGGDARLLKTWMTTSLGRELHSKESEEFYATVLHWLSKNPMLDRAQVRPLIDYICYRYRQDAKFSMKGRSVLALMKSMEEWHVAMHQAKVHRESNFQPSGFKEMFLDKSRRDATGNHTTEIWRCFEILTAKTLADEGRAMGHCVYSYSNSIEKGDISIWSLTKEDTKGNWRMLTIEVRNQKREIVQARGRFNVRADTQSYQAMAHWAGQNNLTIQTSWL